MNPKPVNAGWIEVICGSMFSGKTEELLRRLRRAQIAKMHTIVFKSKVDSRFNKNHIVSHNKLTMKSSIIAKASDIFPLSKKADVIAIDEAQFFDDSLIDVSKKLADIGKRIIIAGFIPLVCDAVNIPKLIHLSAQTVRELPACSKHAQKIAHRTAKIKIDPILFATCGFPA